MKLNKKRYFLILLTTVCALPLRVIAQDATRISKLLGDVSYGVPTSPAFELLPNKPSEVTHLATAHDISANISSFIDGGKLKSGAAFDIRPFAYSVGSLTEYQKKPVAQALYRTVFSMGTASESTTNSDVFVGLGLRIAIIDKGDPRANKDYVKHLEQAYLEAVDVLRPPSNPNQVSAADFQNKVDDFANDPGIKEIRKEFAKSHWNAFRWDIGVGASDRAASGFIKADSLFMDRIGVWTAFGIPLPFNGQLTVSGNTARVKAKSDTSENNRNVVGARARFFVTDGLSLSGEYARIGSNYVENKLNESWNHLAVVVEFKIPTLGGWFGLAYGGDSAHRTDAGAKFSFNYSIYTDKMIKK